GPPRADIRTPPRTGASAPPRAGALTPPRADALTPPRAGALTHPPAGALTHPRAGALTPPPARTWTRSLARQKRALFVSSPIGLGHAWRDVAIAEELRRAVQGLEIQWLAQEPVTRVLEQRGEAIHPASG